MAIIQITNMESVLIHVSEFGTWVACGRLYLDLRRIIEVQEDNFFSFSQMLDAYGNIRLSEPEAYIITRLKSQWRQFIQKPSISFAGSKASLGLESVHSFQALTEDAQLRLNPQTERLSIKLSSPDFETLWRNFQNKSQFEQTRESGLLFLGLYSFPDGVNPKKLEISDLFLEKLLTRVTDYKSERTLESLKGSAEYGPTEFGIRISAEYSEEWRINDERYVKFREIRSKRLSKKSWNESSFLEHSDLLESILSFSEESHKILGIPPLAAISFFKCYTEYVLQGNKLNLDEVNKSASYMLSRGFDNDCFNFIYVVGCAIGFEQVANIRYRFFQDNFLVFDKNLFSKSNEKYDLDIFRIKLNQAATSQDLNGNENDALSNFQPDLSDRADVVSLSIDAVTYGEDRSTTKVHELDNKDLLQSPLTEGLSQSKLSETESNDLNSEQLDKNVDKTFESSNKFDLTDKLSIKSPVVDLNEKSTIPPIAGVAQDLSNQSLISTNKNLRKKNSETFAKTKEVQLVSEKEEPETKKRTRQIKK